MTTCITTVQLDGADVLVLTGQTNVSAASEQYVIGGNYANPAIDFATLLEDTVPASEEFTVIKQRLNPCDEVADETICVFTPFEYLTCASTGEPYTCAGVPYLCATGQTC